MPKPAHTLVTFSGVYGSAAAPIETWSFSLGSTEKVFTDDAERVAAALALASPYANFVAPILRNTTILTRVRVAQVGADGKVTTNANGGYNQGDSFFVVPGDLTATAGATYPLQTALCVSLTTGRAGPTGKGRFFLPAPGKALGTDHRLLEADTTAIATAMASFIAAVDGALDGGVANANTKVSVVSSKGYLSPVTGVRVGRVLDTLRSRRADMVEGYAIAPVSQ